MLLPTPDRSLRGLLVACAALGLVAAVPSSCGGDDFSDGSGGSGGSGPPVEQLGGLLSATLCDLVKGCQGPLFDLGIGSQCKEQFTAQFEEGELPTIKAAIARGTLAYDGSKVDACLAEVKALGCGFDTKRFGGSCQLALAGKVALGGDCTANSECTGDAYCKVDAACPGKCSAREGAGGACKVDDACQNGLTCDEGTNKCVKPGSSGDTCGKGMPCGLSSFCAGADENKGTTGTCKTFDEAFSAAAGASCDLAKGPFCAPPSSCALDSASAAGATFKCAARAASGAPCKVAIPDACADGNYCDGIDLAQNKFEGTCKPLPAAGAPCASQPFGSGCAAGLVCGTDKKCRERGKDTAACGADSECYSGRCTSGACVPSDACNSKP